jgi:hypothetical protein
VRRTLFDRRFRRAATSRATDRHRSTESGWPPRGLGLSTESGPRCSRYLLCIMDSANFALKDLAAYFRARGFHSELRTWAMGDTVLVASQPDDTGVIIAYRRAAYAAMRQDGTWRTLIHGIETDEALSTDDVRLRLSALMECSDAEYHAEFERRARSIGCGRV